MQVWGFGIPKDLLVIVSPLPKSICLYRAFGVVSVPVGDLSVSCSWRRRPPPASPQPCSTEWPGWKETLLAEPGSQRSEPEQTHPDEVKDRYISFVKYRPVFEKWQHWP